MNYAEKCRSIMISIMDDYGKSTEDDRYIRNTFYYQIVQSYTKNTKWISKNAFQTRKEKHPTLDHFITPRLVISALIEERPDILHDETEFKNIFELCTSVVSVTSKENTDLRYELKNGKIVIKECTEKKYNKLGAWFLLKNNKILDRSINFPLLEKIPSWFLDWEKKLTVKI